MAKRIIAIVLVLSFFNLAVSPAFAETQEETDQRQQRAVLAAIGLVALVGVFFMVSKIGKNNFSESNYLPFFDNDSTGKGFRVGFDFYELNYNYNSFKEKEEYAPMINLSWSW